MSIKNNGGKIIKIVRSSMLTDDNHISEKEIDDIENYDELIFNDGTLADYYKQLDSLFEKLK